MQEKSFNHARYWKIGNMHTQTIVSTLNQMQRIQKEINEEFSREYCNPRVVKRLNDSMKHEFKVGLMSHIRERVTNKNKETKAMIKEMENLRVVYFKSFENFDIKGMEDSLQDIRLLQLKLEKMEQDASYIYPATRIEYFKSIVDKLEKDRVAACEKGDVEMFNIAKKGIEMFSRKIDEQIELLDVIEEQESANV